MGDVHSRRSPPFPSPTETVSPVAIPQPPHIQPPRSPNYSPLDADHTGKSKDALLGVDGSIKTQARKPRFSRGDSAEQASGLTPITEDTRSATERQEDQGRSSQTLKELRRQMEELLVYQQMQQQQAPSSHVSGNLNETPRKRRLSATTTADLPTATSQLSSGSLGSGGTIKAIENASPNPPTGQTPSYPFPRIQNSAHANLEPTGQQGQFRLKLPGKTHSRSQSPEENLTSTQQETCPPVLFAPHNDATDDKPEFPSPNLYDLTLKLNADAGLDGWWSNLIDILQTSYGAERISLAIPGDATDLENVPWGQKAVFNQHGSTPAQDSRKPSFQQNNDNDDAPPETPVARTFNSEAFQKVTESSVSNSKPLSNPSIRPPLSSRHSFAGFGHGKKQTGDVDRAQLSKSNSIKLEKKHARIAGKSGPTEVKSSSTSQRPQQPQIALNESASSTTDSIRQAVFPLTRPLEVETDPLIKRTGVVKLFGRTSPVILTREYSENSNQTFKKPAQSPLETVQVTPGSEAPSATIATQGDTSHQGPSSYVPLGLHFYDEYEQIPQSPWSQSPAPSPAPRTHADQNPFFTNHTVDEGAFEKHPPAHDYSTTNPPEAIGIDESKTIIHIPLLHQGRSTNTSPVTLRFPVAVISLLSTIVPYPPNLRRSLADLMPHLTTSFCLAQQYSQLERQLTSKVETPRYGHLLGLGGTFSDASSELELVAGLSGHASYFVGDDSSVSARASVTSPSDRSSTKFSPAISSFGTPGFEIGHTGLGSATISPAVHARDTTDSYFTVQHPKHPRENSSQYRQRLPKSKAKIVASNPPSPGKAGGNGPKFDEMNANDPSLVVASPLQEMKPPSIVSPTQPSSRQASTNSFYNQLQRESRPFSDTIAQLMLHSIPLHLFLAKPQSGEVIWTNAKFDAFRRSKPQEHRMRDPWQNIHSSERDHVSSEWENALRTGSQFTERVRVKRFNDETAYRWFIFRANPLLSATGEVLYWIGSFLDIHEQHIAELKATQEREKFATDAKYRAFSNSIPQVVFEATENRGLIFVNEQWNLYTGQELQEALDLGFAKHVHPDDLEKCGGLSSTRSQDLNEVPVTEGAHGRKPSEVHGVSSALDDLVSRGVASLQKDENGRVFYSTEIRLRSRGGDFRWHLVRLVRVETSSFGSEEASWYGTCTDINDRKNLERELNKAMSQLNNQMESKTKFFSNMSHEIRTPLNGILGTIPFILDTQVDSDQRRMLDTIQNSSTNLRELVDNILDVSRVEAGKMSLVNSWFHVRSMIEDVIDTIASRAIDKNLELNYLMDADVPSMVIGDRFRIRQILINLVGNAVKFTPQGEIYICCNLYRNETASIKSTEVFLNFDVVDTGKGFSAADAERLMQRFSQLGENGSQQNAGSGLGLFLSKQLVEMHGGKLTPSSMEGKGAKFSFNVKVDAPPPPSPNERSTLLRQASSASRRPATSRTTSYDQYSLAPLRPFDPKLQDPAILSPGLDSPASASHSPTFSNTLASSESKTLFPPSAASSALPTPDITTAQLPSLGLGNTDDATNTTPRQPSPARMPPPQLNTPDAPGNVSSASSGNVPPQGPFHISILCPLDNTRRATKQHIRQVVPHEIPFTITALSDVDEWKDTMQSSTDIQCTHLVLNLPATDDILDVIQHVSELDPSSAPVVVIISDLYQKRQISTRVKQMAASGNKVFIVPKPVKPSAFSTIFDPESKRELSKDRNQDMAREINNNFKTVSKMVKERLGNKGYRILLVEDDETNRDVMLKYLDKIKLMSETASNGQEATDMVFSKEPGYFSLIICDIQMPIKNGYDTCRDIRAWEQKNHYPQIPIMALSANAMTDQIEDAARAGFNDYVTKPIKHNELGKMMMGLLDTHQPLLLLRDRLHPGNPQITSRR
ncbi:hypothetical protein N7456_008929 [Penicillium angulare]|uniref:histidine kinase n=1 Tax=Penicillium angulare TaxID=116970 RepID=A0A9W9F3N6_9EURO|nr:hypothetical protein N7456_008929 [Penicillium angulare]